MKASAWVFTAAVALLALPAAAECRNETFEGVSMTVCEADPATDDIRLWLRNEDGALLGTFERVRAALAEDGLDLAFAMNGGMYHDDRRPVGHYRDPMGEVQRLITSPGPGNFGMLPNGVLCLGAGEAAVIETTDFADAAPDCRYASQSGPLLVIDGALHPRFIPDSDSRFVRNGVGVTADGRVMMAISNRPVNFHRFARYFRDVLETPNALYIDGNVSRLYSRDLNRSDPGFPMGPILGVTRPAD